MNYSHAASQSAKQALKHARWMQADMISQGFADVPPVAVFFKLARAAAVAMDQADADLAKAARWDRVQKGMVANHISDLRAVGAWDGE